MFQVKILDKYYFHHEIQNIVNQIVINHDYDDDLIDSIVPNYYRKTENHIEVSCFDPGFTQEIPLTLFKKYSKSYGVIAECKNCQFYKRLGNKKESWGTCSWTLKYSMPFWAELNKYGAISPTHKDCNVFQRIKEEGRCQHQ
ncbi:MAG: hypothetical protein WA916_08790 [Arcobacter sp.]|uniref:hypothetical protein n=1 Tax=Arcobacter sp. TaxID=1872629 RepID=UPI003C7846D4